MNNDDFGTYCNYLFEDEDRIEDQVNDLLEKVSDSDKPIVRLALAKLIHSSIDANGLPLRNRVRRMP
jgi:hypothetical protein